MTLTKENYQERLIDKKISRYLGVFGAISLNGPKYCGKTWTSLNHVASVAYITDVETKEIAQINPKYIFKEEQPQLIDEWQIVPEIWDAVRHECDMDTNKGKFILTGSTTLSKEEQKKVYHSGAGRIAKIEMYPMSLYESNESTGDVSLTDLLNNTVKCGYVKKVELRELAKYIVRGGWPANINTKEEDIDLIPKSYIESILDKDINEDGKQRERNKMLLIMRSLARNESTLVRISTLLKDIAENETNDELVKNRATVTDYIDALDRLHLLANQDGFSINYRSSSRVGKTSKRHFVDPSITCACLNLTIDKLLSDLNTFGLLFEALVERDLRIYIDYLDGNLYHFRDNTSGDEVDAIIEFKDGSYGAIEIKLSSKGIEEAKKSLTTFYKHVKVKPKFMAIIIGYYEAIIKDPETNIYILPITSLKP